MKKNIVKMILSIISCLILFIVSKDVFFKTNEKSEYILPKIDFPQMMGEEYDFSVENSISNEKIEEINNAKEIVAYDTQNANIDISILCENLNVEEKIKTDDGSMIEYGDGTKRLMVQDSGKIMFQDTQQLNEEMKLKDSECIDIAEEFIDSINMDSEELEVFAMVDITCQDIDKPDTKMTIEKQILYNRKINDREVCGGSNVIVSVRSDGSIGKFMTENNCVGKEIKINKVNSVTDGIEMIKEYEGYISVPENTDRINLMDVEIKYWEGEGDTKERIIQPVYEYIGKAYNGEEYLGTVKIIEPIAK